MLIKTTTDESMGSLPGSHRAGSVLECTIVGPLRPFPGSPMQGGSPLPSPTDRRECDSKTLNPEPKP